MTQEKVTDKKKTKDQPPTKVVIRRLPPSLKEKDLLEQLSPLPSYDYFYFMKADFSLGPNAFSRAYINFLNYEDIANFRDKFDNYVFVDNKGNEYPAIVEFSPFQKVPKRKAKKLDAKKGSIDQDSDYLKFLSSLENPDNENIIPIETYLEELEAKERELRANKGVKMVSTPLIDYLRKRREDKKNAVLRARDERKKREIDRKKLRDEERRRRKERERERDRERELQRQKERQKDRDKESKEKQKEPKEETSIKLLKNPDREKDADSQSSKDKQKGEEKDSPVKPKDDRTKLRFSKENREKNKREERNGKDKGPPPERDRPRSGRDRPDSGRPKLARDERPSPRDSDRGKPNRDDHPTSKESDRGKSGRDDRWSDRDRGNRPRSYREERARNNRDRDRDYRDERPRSTGGPPREDKRRDTPPAKSSGPVTGKKDSSKIEKDPGELGKSDNGKQDHGDSVKTDKDTGKSERDRAKTERKTSEKISATPVKQENKETNDSVTKATDEKGRESWKQESIETEDAADDKKRKRKERPERAIYDPRKAMERRQGSKSSTTKSEASESSQDKGQNSGVK